MTIFLICLVISMIITRPIREGLVEGYLKKMFYSRWETFVSSFAKRMF